MKGIILAGGTGSRLYPLTKVTNKHLLPVGNQPMIYYPIHKLIEAELRDILVVTGPEHMGAIVNLLGSGREHGCSFTYRVQDEPGGIAQALGLARGFAAGSRMVVILGDNIFGDAIKVFVDRFRQQASGARLLLKEVDRPQRFGVAELSGERIIGIEEKPAQPKSHFAVTGIYMYDAEVFEIIDTLKPSGRGELEITDVNNHYVERGLMHHDILQGFWTDAGTFESLQRASLLVQSQPMWR